MTDQELLRQVVEDKSDAAFEELLGRHLGLIHGVCARVLGANHPSLPDAIQAVSLLFYRKAGLLRHHPNLGGWLHRAATFTAIRVRTREQKEAARVQLAMKSLYETEPGDSAETTGAWAMVREHLDAALAALPARQRDVVVLHYFEQHPLGTIAGQLDCSLETVRSRLKLARAKLEKLLRRKLGRNAAAMLPGMLLQGLDSEAAGAVPAAICKLCSPSSLRALGPGAKASILALETARAMSLAGVKAAAQVAAGVAGIATFAVVAAVGLLRDRAAEPVPPARPAVVREAGVEQVADREEPVAAVASDNGMDVGRESALQPAAPSAHRTTASAPQPNEQANETAGGGILFKDDFGNGLANWDKITFAQPEDFTQYINATRGTSSGGTQQDANARDSNKADEAIEFVDRQGLIRLEDDEINGVPCKAVVMGGAGTMQVIGIRLKEPVYEAAYAVSFDMKSGNGGTIFLTPQAPVQMEANTWCRFRYENTCTQDESGAVIQVSRVYVDENFVAEVRSPCSFNVDIVQTAYNECRYANLEVTMPKQ